MPPLLPPLGPEFEIGPELVLGPESEFGPDMEFGPGLGPESESDGVQP